MYCTGIIELQTSLLMLIKSRLNFNHDQDGGGIVGRLHYLKHNSTTILFQFCGWLGSRSNWCLSPSVHFHSVFCTVAFFVPFSVANFCTKFLCCSLPQKIFIKCKLYQSEISFGT